MRTLHVIALRELRDMYHPLGHMCNLADYIVKLERGGDWFKPFLNIRTPLSPNLTPIFLFVPPLQLSNQEKNILR